MLPNASPDAIDLLTQILNLDPSKRPSAAQALQHTFFKGDKCLVQEPIVKLIEEKKPREIAPDAIMKEDEEDRIPMRNTEGLLFVKDRPSQKRAISFPTRLENPQIDDIFDGIM
jgi:serine/threonine protein kinase